MSRYAAVRELTLLRVRTFLREPEALFWTFGFPILMAIGLGLAFRDAPEEPVAVLVEAGSVAERYLPQLEAAPEVGVRVAAAEEAARALRRGETGMVLGGADSLVYRFDPMRPESRTARLVVDDVIQRAGGATRPIATLQDARPVRGSRYIDWVIPGLIGLNIMSTGMWGIGFGIVNMRQKKQLKRLIATPMRRSDFLLSQMAARLSFLVLEVPPIVLFAWLVFGVRVEGSLLSLLAAILLGTLAFSAIGLLAASRAKTIEGVSGIMNVVMLPMFILSGVFFSASRFPDAMQPVIRALPLTALNDAMRAVYNDGLSLLAMPVQVGILLAWCVVPFLLAMWIFRWQ